MLLCHCCVALPLSYRIAIVMLYCHSCDAFDVMWLCLRRITLQLLGFTAMVIVPCIYCAALPLSGGFGPVIPRVASLMLNCLCHNALPLSCCLATIIWFCLCHTAFVSGMHVASVALYCHSHEALLLSYCFAIVTWFSPCHTALQDIVVTRVGVIYLICINRGRGCYTPLASVNTSLIHHIPTHVTVSSQLSESQLSELLIIRTLGHRHVFGSSGKKTFWSLEFCYSVAN